MEKNGGLFFWHPSFHPYHFVPGRQRAVPEIAVRTNITDAIFRQPIDNIVVIHHNINHRVVDSPKDVNTLRCSRDGVRSPTDTHDRHKYRVSMTRGRARDDDTELPEGRDNTVVVRNNRTFTVVNSIIS